MAKTTWKDYFTFSKKERISVYILLAIIAGSVIVPYYYQRSFAAPVIDDALQNQVTSVLEAATTDSSAGYALNSNIAKDAPVEIPGKLFYFDPNTLDQAGFKTLGLRDKTIRTIINYRNKGGCFKQPEDIRKIYGLQPTEADRLVPYIRIEKDITVVDVPVYKKPTPVFKTIDINKATEADFKALPGIGDILSKRIIKFRNSLQGFTAVEDIKRTYGLPDSTYQLILPYLTISGDK